MFYILTLILMMLRSELLFYKSYTYIFMYINKNKTEQFYQYRIGEN
jgi:hypothetical protein